MHRPTLTKARTAQLAADLRELRLKALAHGEGEFSLHAAITREVGLEGLLVGLVTELAGGAAMRQLHDALSATLTAEDVAAYRHRQAAKQAAYLAAAATKEQKVAHYQLQGALADFHAAADAAPQA